MSYDDYDKKFTDVSFDELKKFLRWMNEKKGIYPIIIGGWAVYAYKQALGSKDIDVVMPTDKDLNDVLLTEYFPANGYDVKKDQFFNPKYYVKEVEDKGRTKEIIVDVFIGNFSKEDEEGLGIKFHWEEVMKHQELKELGSLSLYVPKLELLVFLKVVASLERTSKYDKTGDPNIPSKIWKDYYDIAILISLNKLDKELLSKFLQESNVQQYVERFLLGYKTDYSKILDDLGMTYQNLEGCFN